MAEMLLKQMIFHYVYCLKSEKVFFESAQVEKLIYCLLVKQLEKLDNTIRNSIEIMDGLSSPAVCCMPEKF